MSHSRIEFIPGAEGRILLDGEDVAPFIRTPVLSDPDLASSIPYEFGWRFARTTKNVIGHGQVG